MTYFHALSGLKPADVDWAWDSATSFWRVCRSSWKPGTTAVKSTRNHAEHCRTILTSVSGICSWIRGPQRPLIQDGINPALDHVDQAGLVKFPIESMSHTAFRLRDRAAEALLGDKSYVILRGEFWKRRSEIWEYLEKHNMDCQEWLDAEMEIFQENGRRIFTTGGRIFDADPE